VLNADGKAFQHAKRKRRSRIIVAAT